MNLNPKKPLILISITNNDFQLKATKCLIKALRQLHSIPYKVGI